MHTSLILVNLYLSDEKTIHQSIQQKPPTSIFSWRRRSTNSGLGSWCTIHPSASPRLLSLSKLLALLHTHTHAHIYIYIYIYICYMCVCRHWIHTCSTVRVVEWYYPDGISSDFWKFAGGTKSWKIRLEDPRHDFFLEKKACIYARNTEYFKEKNDWTLLAAPRFFTHYPHAWVTDINIRFKIIDIFYFTIQHCVKRHKYMTWLKYFWSNLMMFFFSLLS
jgi:hypothetical protein